MSIFEYKDLEDWSNKTECYPFEDSLGNLCITVKSKYESFGGESEARLKEAKEYGIDRLLRFYGKLYLTDLSTSAGIVGTPTPTELYDAASTPEYLISQRECERMKVLVKIPKSTFDEHTANDATCDISKPSSYLSALISVENYERDIDYITTSMEDFLPKMAKADKYITNINIVKEIERLRDVKGAINRYFILNSVTAAAIKEEECEADKESQMEIGFSNDYKPIFALIDGNKHTIGYDCFLEASLLSHPTTANYLIQLGSMASALTNQLSLDFDIFQFLTQYTYPTPVVEIKNNTLDGLQKYDSNGNLFSFANLAKLITLDLDKKPCKDPVTQEEEDFIILDAATRRNIAETSRQSEEFVGNMTFSSDGWKDLKRTGRTVSHYSKDSETSYYRGQRAFDKIYDDVINKLDFNCVLEESLKCMLEAAITRLGEEAFNDPDLSEFFNADGVIEVYGLGGCGAEDPCDDPKLQLKVGLPVFQGINIPDNFPTLDYLAKTIDAALKKLYTTLIDAIVSFIMGIFELMCKAVSATDFAEIGNMFGNGFTSWLSKTIGVDVSTLADGKAWADAALSAGGTGFMGEVGNFYQKMAGSWDAMISDTGVSLNLPNPSTGEVERVFISPELIYQTMGGVKKATEDLEAILTSEELTSVYKGAASEEVEDMAFECLNGGNPEMFTSREDVYDLFSALGEIVDGNFLENPTTTPFSASSACQLGDGTEQDDMARNRLTNKDPLLSDSEIEELLSQEKNRLIEKIKKIHILLKEFRDGTLFPTFPSLFGSEDSLIPEAPPIISAAMATATGELYSPTINNFSVSMTQYVPLWNSEYKLLSTEDEQTFAEHSKNLMKEDTQKPIWLNLPVEGSGYSIDYESFLSPTFALANPFRTTIGYKINTNVTLDLNQTEYQEDPIGANGGLYDWGNDFDAGAWTSEITNYSGDSDSKFETLLKDAGIRIVEIDKSKWDLVKEVFKWMLITASGLVLILGTVGIGAALLGSYSAMLLAITGGAFVSSFALGLTFLISGILVATGLLVGSLIGIWELVSLLFFSDEEAATLDREYVECLHDSGKITDKQWEDLEPKLDELIIETSEARDASQITFIQGLADYLEDIDDENDSHVDSWDISAYLEIPDPDYKTELILKTETSGAGAFNGKRRVYTNAYIRKTPIDQEEVTLKRPEGFSEIITTFERRGVRGSATDSNIVDNLNDAQFFNASAITIQDLQKAGINLLEYDRVETKIANYYMENQSSLLLGRKIAKPDLLETRYSSTIEAPDKTAIEMFEQQIINGNDLQEYHEELLEIFEEIVPATEPTQELLTHYKNDPVIWYEAIWKGCIKNMADRVYNNRMYENEYLNALELEYPKQDILGYNKVKDESIDLTSSIMKLKSSNSDYCDTLTPLRRSGSITGLRLMIRTFIVERVLNSIQVFDTFNTDFMTSDMFKKAVFNNIKIEMGKYDGSFSTTLDGKIFSDMKETASKYFEIQRLLGNEVPELNTDKEAILEIIKMEIDDISTTIASQLRLDTQYHSSTWDDFVFEKLLTAGKRESGDNSPFFESILHPYFEANTRYVKIADDTYTYVAEILFLSTDIVISAECDGPPPPQGEEGCEPVGDYSKVKALLFNNEVYQNLVSFIFPLKDAVTLLSTYHLSSITDPAVFQATEGGKHVTDLFAETKLSTLQTFLACIHGAGETTYIDPFLEKLKT